MLALLKPIGARPAAPSQPMLRRAAERLRHVEALDPWGDRLQRAVLEALDEDMRARLRGRWLGHPLHPTLSDVPIGLWTSSVVLDAAGGERGEAAADLLLWLGILASVPTAAAGVLDWSEATRPSRRQGLVHAACNLLALELFVWSAAARRRSRSKGKRLSAAGAVALVVGGYLGGHLAYAEGVGVEPQARVETARPPTPRLGRRRRA